MTRCKKVMGHHFYVLLYSENKGFNIYRLVLIKRQWQQKSIHMKEFYL
jgi:hypothetical protein